MLRNRVFLVLSVYEIDQISEILVWKGFFSTKLSDARIKNDFIRSTAKTNLMKVTIFLSGYLSRKRRINFVDV